jgi:hypothetical protein
MAEGTITDRIVITKANDRVRAKRTLCSKI